jgi:hypothetical protein
MGNQAVTFDVGYVAQPGRVSRLGRLKFTDVVRTEQMNGYAFALWARVGSTTTKTESLFAT